MNLAIPTSAEQGALPPGLAAAAAAHREPDEGLRWAGCGTRLATFLALAPGMALTGLVLGPLAWVFLTTRGWAFGDAGAVVARDLSPEMIARGIGIATLGILLYYLILFVRRILDAGRIFFFLTERRLVAVRGSRSYSTALHDVGEAEARERYYGGSLAFGGGQTLFGLSNIDAALAEMGQLGISAVDLRHPARNGSDRPPALALGETISWSGRRGWRAVDPSRLIMMALVIPLVIPFLLVLSWAWSRAVGAETRTAAVFEAGGLLLFACLIFGPMAWFVFSRAPSFLDDLLVDMFGTLAVTDRRILFIGPLGKAIDREIPAERLVAADLVQEEPSGRGHIALTLIGERDGEPEFVDLPGVPDAAEAAAAMARLVRQ